MTSDVTWHAGQVERSERPSLGATVWLTGLSGSGKSTIAMAAERVLVDAGRPAYVLVGAEPEVGVEAVRVEKDGAGGFVAQQFVRLLVALANARDVPRERVRDGIHEVIVRRKPKAQSRKPRAESREPFRSAAS